MMLERLPYKIDIAKLQEEYTRVFEPMIIEKPEYKTYFPIQKYYFKRKKDWPEELKSTYTYVISKQVETFFSFEVIVFRVLMPNGCYTWHTDNGQKLHIPVITNEGCKFVIGNEAHDMPADGSLYLFSGQQNYHTFFNAGTTPRVHLIFDDNEY